MIAPNVIQNFFNLTELIVFNSMIPSIIAPIRFNLQMDGLEIQHQLSSASTHQYHTGGSQVKPLCTLPTAFLPLTMQFDYESGATVPHHQTASTSG